jgi:uncharacterized protein
VSEPGSPPTKRTRVRRAPDLGNYDQGVIEEILDAALIAHVGVVGDNSQPFVIPMAVARDGDRLLLHGSTASRLMRAAAGRDVCATITHLDGVIVSRTVFDSSMNYRSVVVLGQATPITEPEEKLDALRILVNHLIPGRWDEARRPNDKELKATTVLSLPLTESSAKIRTGPPADEAADLDLPNWAGEIPLRTVALAPIADPSMNEDLQVPASVDAFVAKHSKQDSPPSDVGKTPTRARREERDG